MDDDKALVDEFLARRDQSSFRALYRAHTGMLYRMAVRLLGLELRAEAEDVVQETWIRAVQRLGTFEWRSSFRTWLTGILVNCVREARKRRRRASTLAVDTTSGTMERSVDLEAAISGLAERARAVFCLHDIEGYTHEEIGRILRISEGTSKSQLSAARRRLRQHLGGEL